MEMVINRPPLSQGVPITFKPLLERTDGIKVIGKSKAAGTSFESQARRFTPSQAILRDRLFSRLPEILKESEEARKFFPDPVQALVGLLSSTPGDYETWREIVEEPYG